MTTLIANKDVRTIAAGIAVARATNTLPATATGNIFVVSGGRILVVAVVGEVTTAVQNQACTLSIGSTPTVGSAANTALGTATSIQNLAIGGKIYSASSGAVVVDTAGAGGAIQTARVLVPIGNVTITTSATNTGSIKWDMLYVPFDSGAQVVAA